MRLDKFLTMQGRYTRAQAKALVRQGRVIVDSVTAADGGMAIDPTQCAVLLDGEQIAYCDQLHLMLNKPAGVTVIPPDRAIDFLENLPVEKFYGIGRATASRLKNMNIRYGRDLKAMDLNMLKSHFGKNGEFYYYIVRGIDDRPVDPGGERKSFGRETTFPQDLTDPGKMRIFIRKLALKVSRMLQKEKVRCRSVTVKVKYSDFNTVTRSMSFHSPTDDGDEIGSIAVELLGRTEAGNKPVRLLGVSSGNLISRSEEELNKNRPVQLEFDFVYGEKTGKSSTPEK